MVAGRPRLCTVEASSAVATEVAEASHIFLRGWLYHWALLWRQTPWHEAERELNICFDERVSAPVLPTSRRSTACRCPASLDHLLDYEDQPDDVDSRIGNPAYVSVFNRAGGFQPNTNIEDARQRWLFRMVHSQRPLQEKMALFWHNHFATAYSKIAGTFGAVQGTKMMANVSGQLPGPQGQLELFREHALGSFTDLLIEVAKDPAMLVWLDGRVEHASAPAGELRPRDHGAVHVRCRQLHRSRTSTPRRACSPAGISGSSAAATIRTTTTSSCTSPNNHDPTAKTFTFPIYSNGSHTIPARAAPPACRTASTSSPRWRGIPQTARRLARKMWNFFVSEVVPPDDGDDRRRRERLSAERHRASGRWCTTCCARVSSRTRATGTRATRGRSSTSCGRSRRSAGRGSRSTPRATPLIPMGQVLFEPPDVNGWELGQGWFSTGAMLARMNFAGTLAFNQRFNLARDARRRAVVAGRAARILARSAVAARRTTSGPMDRPAARSCRRAATWTGSDAQLPVEGQWSGAADHRVVRVSVRLDGEIAHGCLSSRFHTRRRFGVHGRLRRAGVSERPGPRPGRARTQPRDRVSRRRQRRAEHRRAVSGCVLLQPAAEHLRFRRGRCCRLAATRAARRSGCTRVWAACENLTTRAAWRSCSGPAI